MSKGGSSQKPKTQRSGKKARGGGGRGFLLGLIAVLFAVPVVAAVAAWQSPLGLPNIKVEWPHAASPAAASAPAPAAQGTPKKTAAPAVAVTATPVRREATPVAPTKVPVPETTPTSRPVAIPTVSPSPTPGGKIMLKVPIYRQQHTLSCEVASLRMALATFGVQLPENDLLAALARDPTPRKVIGDTIQWGDPDTGFVGQWDGVYLQDGYGVYEQPIADLGTSYGFQATRSGKNVDPKQLYTSVRQGSPSVVWMPYDLTAKGRGSWVTPAGKQIPYVVTERL
jgi:uncharacterized protein YvpB